MLKTKIPFKNLPKEAREILDACPSFVVPEKATDLIDMAMGGEGNDFFEVAYDVPEKGRVIEATVTRVKNGIVGNYPEPYMRRRDSEAVLIADSLPTDKDTFQNRFKQDFEPVRQETLEWLKNQDLIVAPFLAGQPGMGIDAIAIAPLNTAFFVYGLAQLQGAIGLNEIPENFNPKAVIYVAPPFRHSHFDGHQIVVHNRRKEVHELFSYNLYPGPSAKKGVYGMLLTLGEKEGWVTTHCATVQVITPYDNVVTIMHEGASGGGKSEMLETAHREVDGTLLLGRNVVSKEKRYLTLPRSCELHPVTDDMAPCHPSLQGKNGKLSLIDAEKGWFVRTNHITSYGKDIHIEKLTAQPPEPLLFLNVDAAPGSRALIWEHIMDAPGKPCPNPRVVVPRHIIENIVNGPATIDIRSMGIRTPPCTKKKPSYGIIGIFHVLPPALAWIWRLVAPRGYANPSIIETKGLSSEGVGSYWPFATGRKVDQANLLLKQIQSTPNVRYVLSPNQHVGAWETSFMPQWLMREYLARRGNARFSSKQMEPARCPIIGYAMNNITIEGTAIPTWFLKVETQPEVGLEGYDQGAKMLTDFFKETVKEFLVPDLLPLGRSIIECTLADGDMAAYEKLIPQESR